MKKILFIEYCNATPHLETSLELARLHLEAGDQVYWHFWGHQVPYTDWLLPAAHFPPLMTPEQRGLRCIRHKNLRSCLTMPKLRPVPVSWNDQSWRTLEELLECRWNDAEIGIGVANSLISRLQGASFQIERHQALIQAMMTSYAASFQATLEVAQRLRPESAYVFNGRFCCQHATASALQRLNIPVRYHERGSCKNSYHVRTFVAGDREACQKNILKAWETALQEGPDEAQGIGRIFFAKNRSGVEQGWLAFNTRQAPGKLPALPEGKKIISYFQSSDDEYIVRNKLFGNKPWNHQTEAFQAVLDTVREHPAYHLVVRLHPHLCLKSEEDRKVWTNYLLPENCTLIAPESEVDSYSLIERSDMVFTYGSTVGIESVYLGVPSVLLGGSNYDTLAGATRITSKEQLAAVLAQGVAPPARDNALAYGYYAKTMGTPFVLYRPDDLFTGSFMGIHLKEMPRAAQWLHKVMRYL